MKYYLYFDGYGNLGKVIDEIELSEKYNGNPEKFQREVCGGNSPERGNITGNVSTLSFETEKDLEEYLESLGDEITGFYGCESESRPYNF